MNDAIIQPSISIKRSLLKLAMILIAPKSIDSQFNPETSTISVGRCQYLNPERSGLCDDWSIRLALCSLRLLLFILLTVLVANAQTTSPTDGGIPSGLSQGSQGQDNIDNVNHFNGNLSFNLPLIAISGRGGARTSISLTRNSIHWVVTKGQDRNHITYAARADFDGKAPSLPFYDPVRLYSQPSTGQGALCLQSSSGYPATTLRRFLLISSDGTEQELRDQIYDGKPLTYNFFGTGALRGTIFRSSDGSDMTFISDVPVYDNCSNNRSLNGTGYLLLRDGTRYRFVGGLIQAIRDRNGNTLAFTYGTNPNEVRTYNRLTGITDSLNGTISITYSDFGVVNPPVVLYDQITYKGFGGNQRSIKVWYSDLGQALRAGYTPQTYNCLFPNLNSSWICGGTTGNTLNYTANVVNKVELPSGRSYQLYYNPYRELARVELPTGGAIEYDYSPQNPDYSTTKIITRRVAERRVFLNASDTSPVSKEIYSFSLSTDTSVTPNIYTTTCVVEYRDPNNLLFSQRHLFHGNGDSKALKGYPPSYKAWDEGLEYQTDILDSGGMVVRTVKNTWQQRAHVTWWPQPETASESQSTEPAQDPRIVETDVILAETNQQSKTTFVYSDDRHNNLTDVYAYDYGPGAPGALLRRTHTDYLTYNSVNSINYADPANGQSYTPVDPHLRSLPTQQWVSTDALGNNKQALTVYEYDNYTTDTLHEGLKPYAAISGLDSAYTASYGTRGNVTSITRYANAANGTGPITGAMQYDIAGNVVKAIDGRGFATTLDFSDRFGLPDSESQTNTPPLELGTLMSYGFPTKVTNALGQIAYTQYDYYLGMSVNSEDANGVVTSEDYGNGNLDLLDRPSKLIRAINSTVAKSQTNFSYDDANRTVTTTSDLNTFNDAILQTQMIYDGLGRTIESRQYEGGLNYIAVKTQYDSLGRAFKVSNPFRPWNSEPEIWTTNSFDALGRVISVTMPGNAVVVISYSGNQVLVTDQTGKQRMSTTNALGHLKDMWEITAADSATEAISFPGHTEITAGYHTSYSYDVLDDMTNVTQGTQPPRTFAYDSLKRLTSTTNPESGTINYQYDNNGNLTQKTDARGIVTTYSYDALNRNTSVVYSNDPAGTPAVHRYYDGFRDGVDNGIPYSSGRLWQTETGGSTASRTTINSFDALGHPLSESQQFYWGFGWSPPFTVLRDPYNLAGGVTSQTYPSGNKVAYSYDPAGRIAGFSGNLGDAIQRNYSTEILYSAQGAMTKEKFGTNTPIFNKLLYNSRGQLAEIRASTSYTGPTDTTWNRGKFINWYSLQCGGAGCNNSDNNGNLRKQETFVPNNDQNTSPISWYQQYDYDSLNRLERAHEYTGNTSLDWQQSYSYDRWGNRTINTTSGATYGWGINAMQTAIDPATNRLYAPNDPNHLLIDYDAAGNQKKDSYTGNGERLYDAENRMIAAQDNAGGWTYYTYDGDGRRVNTTQSTANAQRWQIYGFEGELVAEYTRSPWARGQLLTLAGEYGYRNGQLLVKATVGTTLAPTGGGGFETPNVGNGNYVLNPSGAGWGFSGTTGISGNGSGLTSGNPNAPEGNQVAFIQGGSSSIISQTINGLTPGATYAVTFSAAQRGNCCGAGGEDFRVFIADDLLGSVPVGTFKPGTTDYQDYSTVVFSPQLGSTLVLKFVGLNSSGGDNTAFIDNVRITIIDNVEWMVTDQLGTPRMVFDKIGSLLGVKRHDYLPFGEELSGGQGARTNALGYGAPDGVRQKFTQKERDIETGLDYFLARYYSSTQGRFTGADSVGGRVNNPQTLNLYTYVSNNPLKYIDPTGNQQSIQELQKNIPQEPEGKQEKQLPPPLPPARPMDPSNLPPVQVSPAAPQSTAPKVDVFETGLPPLLQTGAPIPGRVVTNSVNETNQPTAITAEIGYQVVDQYGNPFTQTTSEGDLFIGYEEIEVSPQSVLDVPGGPPQQARTAQAELGPQGQFPDTINLTSGSSGIRIPNNTNVQSRQTIYVVNPETGTRYDVRLNLISITRSGVTITDVSNGPPNRRH